MIVMVTNLLLVLLYAGGAFSQSIDCKSLMIQTDSPQRGPSPFKIKIHTKFYKPKKAVKVTVYSMDNSKFEGIMIQARLVPDKDQTPQGTFSGASRQLMLQNCPHASGSAYVKVNRQPLSRLTFSWNTPKYIGHIQFVATIVQNQRTFWVRERSLVIIDPTIPLPTPLVPQENIIPMTKQIDTAECGKTRGCYREPPGCWELLCKYIVTWKDVNNTVEFEMSMATGRIHNVWMTFALSDDIWEGNDYAIDCIEHFKYGIVSVSLSYIVEINKIKEPDNPKNGILFEEGSHYHNRLRCRFAIHKFAGNSHDFYLRGGKWHVLLGGGKAWDGKKSIHGFGIGRIPIVSVDQVSMQDVVDISGVSRYPLMKAHVILMILTWLFCAPIGCLMSMYYKKMWPNNRSCGKRYWFVVYWPCMVLVLILTILSFIFFLVDFGGYIQPPYLPLKAHAIMLLIVFIGVLIIPLIMLLVRYTIGCLRFFFQVVCFLVSLVTFILAIPTTLIGLEYGKNYIPWWTTWILIVVMLIQLIVDILLKIHDFCYYEKNKEREEKYEYEKRENPKMHIPEPHPVGRYFKKVMLFIHVFFTTVLVAIAIIVIAAA